MKIGIIGTGVAAESHFKILSQIPDIRTVAVFGRDNSHLEWIGERWNLAPYSSITEMVSERKLDIVIIANRNNHHAVDAMEALESGANVLVEKPLGLSVEERCAILTCAERSGKKVGVVFQKRYDPLINKIRKIVLQGKCGDIAFASSTILMARSADYFSSKDWLLDRSKSGGGILLNQAIHYMDILLWVLNSPVENVSGWVSNHIRKLSFEDTGSVAVRLENGIRLSINATIACQKKLRNRIEIIGDKMSALMEGRRLRIISDTEDLVFDDSEGYDYDGDLLRLWSDYISSVKGSSVFLCEAKNCIEVHNLISEIYKSRIE